MSNNLTIFKIELVSSCIFNEYFTDKDVDNIKFVLSETFFVESRILGEYSSVRCEIIVFDDSGTTYSLCKIQNEIKEKISSYIGKDFKLTIDFSEYKNIFSKNTFCHVRKVKEQMYE